ncbi:MAG: hypothetical protein WC188_13265, partial [Candidatus Caldatribacteriota bacterium]
AITPVLSFVTNKKESRSAIDVAKYSTLKGEAKYAQGILMNARNSSGLESFSNYLKYIGTQTITEEEFVDAATPALKIWGQALGNATPVGWGMNYYELVKSRGKNDIWGNDLNKVGKIGIILGPIIPNYIGVPVDIGNGIYNEITK